MRQGSHSKRSRGRGGNRRSGTPNRNHTFDSNGPDIRIRGNAHQVHEKYINLAREASTNGEVVLAESYFQHAEHYYRILSAFTDETNADNNKNRSNSASQQSHNHSATQVTQPSPNMESKIEPKQDTHREQLEHGHSKENEAEVASENSEHRDKMASQMQEPETNAVKDHPTLALRSDERLNEYAEDNPSAEDVEKTHTLKLENGADVEQKKVEQVKPRRRRSPRSIPEGNFPTE
ncbi:MAG: hypothetical protein CMM58_14145 [Rhodospirillaceae bacterium]|nr:hypothetical protein [Rhodospirillaceae bacterium]|tara:strand:+ start:6991 stop:7695 length:705 start_codon:yes stop_codon:yes gene_type:complete